MYMIYEMIYIYVEVYMSNNFYIIIFWKKSLEMNIPAILSALSFCIYSV